MTHDASPDPTIRSDRPQPRPLRLRDRGRLMFAGLRDRSRFAGTPPGVHTDYSLFLAASIRAEELRAHEWAERERHVVLAALAQAAAQIDRPHPTITDPGDYRRASTSHADWAAAYRQARRDRSDLTKLLAAEHAHGRLSAQSEERHRHLNLLAQLVHEDFTRTFEREVSLYQRARTGWFGIGGRKNADLPPYGTAGQQTAITSAFEPTPLERR